MGILPQVGVRELRQNLSVYLRRIRAGESLEVTDRGRSVALLTPLPEDLSPLERLVKAGRAKPAIRELKGISPPPGRSSLRLSHALEQERAES